MSNPYRGGPDQDAFFFIVIFLALMGLFVFILLGAAT